MPAAFGPIEYARLTEKHGEYDRDYWAELRALYEGGKRLLGDAAIIKRLFPKHDGETEASFAERLKRAFYVNHLGTLVDFIVAGLAQDPLVLQAAEDEAATTIDPWWAAFTLNCKRAGTPGDEESLSDLVRGCMRTGLMLGRTFVMVNVPQASPDDAVTLADQVATGALDAFVSEVRPEEVFDFAFGDDGNLDWLIHHTCDRRRVNPLQARKYARHCYTLYTRTHWARYEVEIGEDKPEPDARALIHPVAQGEHTFGLVPFAYLELPAGLWLGNKVHSMARDYLNRSCALSFAEFRSLNQQLYEFLAPEIPGVDTPISVAQTNPDRAKTRRSGPGIVQERGSADRAEFIGPNTAGYTHTLQSLEQVRADIHLVTYQMALNQDNSGGAIRRSAESKKTDGESTLIVLKALGELGRKIGDAVVHLVAAARQEAVRYRAAGFAQFEVDDAGDSVERAAAVETISLPSATFQQLHKTELATRILPKPLRTRENVEAISAELRQAITQDQYLQLPTAAPTSTPLGDAHDESAIENTTTNDQEAGTR